MLRELFLWEKGSGKWRGFNNFWILFINKCLEAENISWFVLSHTWNKNKILVSIQEIQAVACSNHYLFRCSVLLGWKSRTECAVWNWVSFTVRSTKSYVGDFFVCLAYRMFLVYFLVYEFVCILNVKIYLISCDIKNTGSNIVLSINMCLWKLMYWERSQEGKQSYN